MPLEMRKKAKLAATEKYDSFTECLLLVDTKPSPSHE